MLACSDPAVNLESGIWGGWCNLKLSSSSSIAWQRGRLERYILEHLNAFPARVTSVQPRIAVSRHDGIQEDAMQYLCSHTN